MCAAPLFQWGSGPGEGKSVSRCMWPVRSGRAGSRPRTGRQARRSIIPRKFRQGSACGRSMASTTPTSEKNVPASGSSVPHAEEYGQRALCYPLLSPFFHWQRSACGTSAPNHRTTRHGKSREGDGQQSEATPSTAVASSSTQALRAGHFVRALTTPTSALKRQASARSVTHAELHALRPPCRTSPSSRVRSQSEFRDSQCRSLWSLPICSLFLLPSSTQ